MQTWLHPTTETHLRPLPIPLPSPSPCSHIIRPQSCTCFETPHSLTAPANHDAHPSVPKVGEGEQAQFFFFLSSVSLSNHQAGIAYEC